MFKLYVFTLNFSARARQAMHENPFYKMGQFPFYSRKDNGGFFQVFQTNSPQILQQPLELNCFTHSFFHKSQVELAANQGCPNLRQFYHLVSEIKSKENVYVLFRIAIHGAIGNHHHFEMEEMVKVKHKVKYNRINVSPDVIAKLILNSFPLEARHVFTVYAPLNIQLISCGSGNADRYFQLERNSLAASLSRKLYEWKIFSKIQAPTTDVSVPKDFPYFKTLRMEENLQFPDIESSLDAVLGDQYYRRGVNCARTHIEHHLVANGKKKLFESVSSEFYKNEKCPSWLFMSEIIRLQKMGYKLIYTVQTDGSIKVTDYINQTEFIDVNDLKFEAHRDVLLQYFWSFFIYDFIARQDSEFSKYCLPVSGTDILAMIGDIESAKRREQIVIILNKIERFLQPRLNSFNSHSHVRQIIDTILFLNPVFGGCRVQKWNVGELKKEFSNPNGLLPDFNDG